MHGGEDASDEPNAEFTRNCADDLKQRDEPPKKVKTSAGDFQVQDLTCPVCGRRDRWKLDALNQHLDLCLNRMSRLFLMPMCPPTGAENVI
jgi:hypothetical protein